jgi:hypothetical protein
MSKERELITECVGELWLERMEVEEYFVRIADDHARHFAFDRLIRNAHPNWSVARIVVEER